jgi:hypothetical protein
VPGPLTLRVQRLEREADHFSPSRVGVKNAWSHTSTISYILSVFFLVKRRDDFTFTLSFTVICMSSCGNSCLCVFVSRFGGRYVNADRIRTTHNLRRHNLELPGRLLFVN